MPTKLFVNYSSYRTASYHSGEDYGEWSESNDFSLSGVKLSKNDYEYSEAFTLPQEVKEGDRVYVLWMTYSTGDSFGNADGLGEIIWVFPTEELAIAAKKLWEGSEKYSIDFDIGEGHSKTLSNVAYGYFENQDSIDISSFIVTK